MAPLHRKRGAVARSSDTRVLAFQDLTKETDGSRKSLQLSKAASQFCGGGEDSLLLEGEGARHNSKMHGIRDAGKGGSRRGSINDIPMRHMASLAFAVSARPVLSPSSSKCSKLPASFRRFRPTLRPLCNRLLSRSRTSRTPAAPPWCLARFKTPDAWDA